MARGKRSSRKNVSDLEPTISQACPNKTLTAAGLLGLLTRFPFHRYAYIILPTIAPTSIPYTRENRDQSRDSLYLCLKRHGMAANQLRVQR